MTRTPKHALLAIVCLATSVPLTACITHGSGPPQGPVVGVYERGGPPAHAPAHGYRRKHRVDHHDVELVFDSGLGVYVVVGFPGVYFHADHYFRYVGSSWQISLRPDSGWSVSARDSVPPGLRGKKVGKAKGRPPGPANHRD